MFLAYIFYRHADRMADRQTKRWANEMKDTNRIEKRTNIIAITEQVN